MKRDKVINYSSNTANSDTIKGAIVNNSDIDKNLLAGEIAVVMTSDNEALYTLNHDKTELIEYKPYYKIKAYIDEQTAGVMKNEEVTITFASNVGNIPSNAKAVITFKDEGIEPLEVVYDGTNLSYVAYINPGLTYSVLGYAVDGYTVSGGLTDIVAVYNVKRHTTINYNQKKVIVNLTANNGIPSNAQIDVVYNGSSHIKQYDGQSTSLIFNLPLNTAYTVKPLYVEKYAITSPIEVTVNNNVEETHTISYNQDKYSVIFKEHIEASNHIFEWKPNDAGASLTYKYSYNGTEYSGTTTFAFTGTTIGNKQSYFYPKDAEIVFTINSVSGYSSTNSIEEQTSGSIKETVNTIQYKENSYFSIYIDTSVSGPDAMVTEGMDYEGTSMKEFMGKIRRCVIEDVTSATTEEGTIPMANIRFLDDANGTLYASGTSAPITVKDVMVFFPEYWYLGIQDTSNSNKWEYRFSNVEQDGYNYSPAFLLGVYKASSVTGDGSGSYGNSGTTQIYSVSGGYRVTGVSNTNFKAKAAARGDGFQIIDYEMHKTIANLFYLKYKNTNAQAICGAGPHVYTGRTNGSTDALGMTDTTSDASSAGPINNSNTGATFVNFLGLEGAWGYVYENVEGLEIEDRLWNISIPSKYKKDGGGKRSVQAGTSDGWITKLAAGEKMDVVPTNVGGSDSTYFSDYYWQNSGSRVLFRSLYVADSSGGVACVYAENVASSTGNVVGARLAFRGKIHDLDNNIDLN